MPAPHVPRPRVVLSLLLAAFCAIALVEGCRAPTNAAYPEPSSRTAATPVTALTPAQAKAAWEDAKGVFESRCVVCHGGATTPPAS